MIRFGNVYMTITDFMKNLPLYTSYVGGWQNQYPIHRAGGWPEYQWIQCTSGRGLLKLEDRELTVAPGQGMLLFPNEFHEYYALNEPWEVRWFSFNGTQVFGLLRSLQLTHSQVLTLSEPDPVLNKMYRLLAAAESEEPMAALECSALSYQIILDLYRYGALTDVRSRQQHFTQLAPALRYVEAHYQHPISLDELAMELGVSHQHTCLLFRQALGARPVEYITKVRLRKAKELLTEEPNLDMGEVARRVGYENQSYFIKMFKRYEGITPGKFRKR